MILILYCFDSKLIDNIFKHVYILCKALLRDNIDVFEAMHLPKDFTK